MPATNDVLPEVYSASEIALAAGVDPSRVRQWADAHGLTPLSGGYYRTSHAVRLVRHLISTVEVEPAPHELFGRRFGERRSRALPLVLTTAAHVALVGALVLMATAARASRRSDLAPVTTRLVFLAAPGAGGGGGGGGHRELVRASAAERKGRSRLPSPILPRPAPERAKPSPALGPAPAPDPPAVVAPVVPAEADARQTAGEPIELPSQPESRGPGVNGEAGSGTAGGIGPGSGPGIGAGNGGGTGGGPYRPGSGINPPSLLREVKPDYTEEGRRRSIEGDVDLEIVVRSDGGVGDVTLVRGLGAGLDERAIDAVRQWRFSPATRHGAPVDVIVQVSVAFRLR